METVMQLLEAKGRDIWSIAPNAPVIDALKLMAEKEIGSLLALEDGKLVGIVSERDYARKVVLEGKSSKDTPTRDIMTTPVVYVRPDQRLEACMALMTEKRTRHLPVLDGEKVIGIVSIGDLLKSIISEQRFIIEQLENYIKS